MSCKDVRLNQLLRIYIDGIPLDLASTLLPLRTWLKPSTLFHIHLNAKSQKYFLDKSINKNHQKINSYSFLGIIGGLEIAMENKEKILAGFTNKIHAKIVWDLAPTLVSTVELLVEREFYYRC